MAPRIRDYPDDPEEWPDLEEELIPDLQEIPMSGPYGPAFTYLHAARVTIDAGLIKPTILLVRTAARLTLRAAAEHDEEVTDQEARDLRTIAEGDFTWEEPEDLLVTMGTLSAFVERRVTVAE